VSTYAGQPESVARARGDTILERRLTRQIIGVAGVLAGIGGGAFVATSGHFRAGSLTPSRFRSRQQRETGLTRAREYHNSDSHVTCTDESIVLP